MGSISFEIFLCEDVCCLIKKRPVGIRETGLFSVLSKILGPSKRRVFKDKTLSSSSFFLFVVCSLIFLAHLVHALQLSVYSTVGEIMMFFWLKINIFNIKGHKKALYSLAKYFFFSLFLNTN